MNLRSINIVLAATCAVLLGLVAIQAGWIWQSYSLREDLFDQGVSQAMSQVAQSLEMHEADVFFHNAGYPGATNMVNKMYDTLQTLKTYNTSVKLVDSTGQKALKFAFSDTSGAFVSKFIGTVTYLQEHQNPLSDTKIDNVRLPSSNDREKKLIEEQFKKYNHLFEDLAVKFMLDDKCLRDRLDSARINGLIAKELKEAGIHTPYRYAVFDHFSHVPIFGTLKDVPKAETVNYYSMQLFANDLYKNSGILVLYFPYKKNYLFQSMWIMLATTLTFLFIIAGAFGASFFIIYRQKKLDLLKTDFINNMTHEFKTPVASISLATQMMKNEKILNDPEKIRRYSGIIEEENKRLSGHIENVLQVARYDKGEFKLNITDININELLTDISDSLELRINNEGGELIRRLDAAKDLIRGDKSHLTNVFYNVLENAIKYRKESSLRIILSTTNTAKGVTIAVQDNGIGISKDDQKMIFEKFYRVPTGNIHNVKGFGLGLSYVKIIVDAHRGSIRLDSEPDAGSKFEIYLPFSA
jgi:two-component system phosphate regulon sensor histidine kinase PhoR